jgi:hypothetical protein
MSFGEENMKRRERNREKCEKKERRRQRGNLGSKDVKNEEKKWATKKPRRSREE